MINELTQNVLTYKFKEHNYYTTYTAALYDCSIITAKQKFYRWQSLTLPVVLQHYK